jgi:hypothetical protein
MKKLIFIFSMFFLVTLSSCDETKLDIVNFGTINGTVLDGETYKPLSGVLVTTSPASVALITNELGNFTIDKVKEGEVAISVKKNEYLNNTLSVATYGSEVTKLSFLMFKDKNDIGAVSIYDPVPGNGAVDQLLAITLKWKVDMKKVTTSLTYSIYIFESGSTVQKLLGEDVALPEVTTSGLKNSTTYFWYVIAKYDGNKVANSPTWSFKTMSN